jgi:hypothetical protein
MPSKVLGNCFWRVVGVGMVGGVISIGLKAWHKLIQPGFIGNIIFYTVLHCAPLVLSITSIEFFFITSMKIL